MGIKLKKFADDFGQKHAELYKFIKFSFAGIITSVAEFALYYLLAYKVLAGMNSQPVDIWILHYEGRGFMWSFLISAAIGYLLAYIFNRKITFTADSNPVFSLVAYVIMVIFTIFMTTYLGMELIKYTSTMGETAAKIGEAIAKPVVALLATVWTYPINRFIIHRKKHS